MTFGGFMSNPMTETAAPVGITGNIHQRRHPLEGLYSQCRAQGSVDPQFLFKERGTLEESWRIAILTCSGRVWLRCLKLTEPNCACFCRSLEDASCPEHVGEGWAYYSEPDAGWRIRNVKVVLMKHKGNFLTNSGDLRTPSCDN